MTEVFARERERERERGRAPCFRGDFNALFFDMA